MFARLLRGDSVRPDLFLAALTAGTRRSLVVLQRLAFSVQSLVEPSVSAFRYVMRSCPRIRVDGGGQAPSGRGARSPTHSTSSSISPRPPPSDLGLCAIFTRLDCLHRSPRSPFPLRGDLPPSSGLEFPWAPGGMERRPATTKNVLEAMVRASCPLGCTCWTQRPPGPSWQCRDKPT